MQYYHAVVLILIFLGIFVWIIIEAKQQLSTKNLYPKSRESFEKYICDWLKRVNFKNDSLDQVSMYIYENYQEIADRYEIETGRIFLTSNMTTAMSNAARKYASPK